MAPTIIRVKRKIDEVQEADQKIVLNCKKQKVNEKDVYSQFSFVGTVEEKGAIPEHILKLSKKEAESIVQKSKSKDLQSSLSNRVSENIEKSKEKRFKVVNFLRSADSTIEESNILDVEQEEEAKNEASNEPKSYVYDIYVTQDDFSTVLKDDMIDLNDLSILDYNDYLYSCPRLTNDENENDLEEDDEDSNDENHWRNEYPDEDEFSDGSSIDERAMRRAMQNFGMGEDNELSTTDEEDVYNEGRENEFVYSIDTEEYGFDDDYDYSTGERYGSSYARYKKRIMRDLEKGDSESTTDSDE